MDILFKDLDLALFFILDIKTEKIIEKCAIFDFGFGFVFYIGYQDRIIKTKLSRQNYQDRIIKTELSTQNYQDKIIKTENIFFDLVGLVTFLLIKLFE